jgi:hypothetical protein
VGNECKRLVNEARRVGAEDRLPRSGRMVILFYLAPADLPPSLPFSSIALDGFAGVTLLPGDAGEHLVAAADVFGAAGETPSFPLFHLVIFTNATESPHYYALLYCCFCILN